MRYFPISVRLEDRPCVVIGSGPEVERRVDALLRAGADVTVIGPETPRGLADTTGRLRHRARAYTRGDLRGMYLAYLVTTEEDVAAAVAEEAEHEHVLLNVVDCPAHCSFISPAVVRRGDLTIAVSTGGASPLLARRLRQRLEAEFGPEYESLLVLLRDVRAQLAEGGRSGEERRRVFAHLIDSPLLEHLRLQDRAAVDRLLHAALGTEDRAGKNGDPS